MATYTDSYLGGEDSYKLNEFEVYGASRLGNYKVDETIVESPDAPTNSG